MKRLTGLILILFSLSACNLLSQQDAAAPITTEDSGTSQEITSPENSNFPEPGFQLYIAEEYGIAFQFPVEWFVLDAPDNIKALGNGYTVTLASYDIMNAPGRDGIPEDEVKIDVNIGGMNTMFGDDLSLETMQEYVNTVDDTQQVLSDEILTLSDGTPILKMEIEGRIGANAMTYNTVIDGTAISLGGFGDRALIEQIALSLHSVSVG